MTKPSLTLYHFKNLPIFDQLTLEEAHLRAGNENICIINEGTPKSAIVMGISGKVDELVDKSAYSLTPIPIIRRFSGGGTVVVENSTFFVTFILNKAPFQLTTCPKMLLDWTAGIYLPLFSHIDFAIRENDYVLGEKKIGGNAQYFTKTRVLHHTSFLWNYTPDKMRLLKIPKKMPEYRKNRSHEAFITTLHQHFESKEHFSSKLKEALFQIFTIEKNTSSFCLKTDPIFSKTYRKALSHVECI